MRLIFAHDHIFFNYKGILYSNGGLKKEMIERYTSVFEEVTILSRQQKISELNNKLSLASCQNVSFVEIPNFKNLKTYYKILDAKKTISKEIKKCDFVIARLPSSIGSLAIQYAKKYNKPYAVEVVGCAWDAYWNHGSIIGKVLAPYVYFKTRGLVNNSKFALYVTNNFLQRRYPTKGKSISCSNVEIPKTSDAILDKRLQKINNIKSMDILKIGMIGSLTSKYKGFDIAIEAIRLLTANFHKVELHILGAGDCTNWKRYAESLGVLDQVFFHGSLPSGEPVFQWIDNLDIYIQPSRTEGLPRALIEAMSRACPAIGSRVGGISDLLEEKCMHKNEDSKDLANKINNLLVNKEEMLNQAKRNYIISKNYVKEILDYRRTKFLKEFRQSARVHKN